jgi:hypothetical protein
MARKSESLDSLRQRKSAIEADRNRLQNDIREIESQLPLSWADLSQRERLKFRRDGLREGLTTIPERLASVDYYIGLAQLQQLAMEHARLVAELEAAKEKYSESQEIFRQRVSEAEIEIFEKPLSLRKSEDFYFVPDPRDERRLEKISDAAYRELGLKELGGRIREIEIEIERVNFSARTYHSDLLNPEGWEAGCQEFAEKMYHVYSKKASSEA